MPTDKEWMEAMAEVAGIAPKRESGFITVGEFSRQYGLAASSAKIRLERAVRDGKMEKKIFRTIRSNAAHYRVINIPEQKKNERRH